MSLLRWDDGAILKDGSYTASRMAFSLGRRGDAQAPFARTTVSRPPGSPA